MNITIALLRAFLTFLEEGRCATFSQGFARLEYERFCDRCGQRQFLIDRKWQSVGRVRNRRCGCRFVNNKEAA